MTTYKGDHELDARLVQLLHGGEVRFWSWHTTEGGTHEEYRPDDKGDMPEREMRLPGSGEWKPVPPLSGSYEGMGMLEEAMAAEGWYLTLQTAPTGRIVWPHIPGAHEHRRAVAKFVKSFLADLAAPHKAVADDYVPLAVAHAAESALLAMKEARP